MPSTVLLASSEISARAVVIAVVVLLLSGLMLLLVTRRGSRSAAPSVPAVPPSERAGTAALLLMVEAGEALIDSGYDVMSVRTSLEDIARVNGVPRAEIIAMPTALFVSAQTEGGLRTGAVSTGHHRLRLHQIEELDEVVGLTRQGRIDPASARARILEIRSLAAPFSPSLRLLGQVLTAVALAVLLDGSWVDLGVAAVLGAMVGALFLAGGAVHPQFRVLLTVGASFGVSLAVFLLLRAGLDIEILPTLVSPLVTLLPGALLTTAIMELATGQMIAGAGRLAAGGMQLLLLALGIVAAGALAGVPAIELAAAPASLEPLGRWVAVAVFGVGVVLGQCARARSLGWILLVLYVAYGSQVLGDAVFGGVLSAFVGAVVMTPVAVIVARQPSGPPALVSFMPAFWLLVPGALGLVGITTVLGGDEYGLGTLVTTTSTMVAIALGVLVGLAVSTLGRGRRAGAPPGVSAR